MPDYPRRLPLITLLQSDFINRKGRSRRNSPPFIPRARGEKERRKGGREERRGFIGGGKKLGFSLVAMFKYLKGKIYVSTRGVPFSEDWRDWKRLESLITGRKEAVLESQVTVCTSFSFFLTHSLAQFKGRGVFHGVKSVNSSLIFLILFGDNWIFTTKHAFKHMFCFFTRERLEIGKSRSCYLKWQIRSKIIRTDGFNGDGIQYESSKLVGSVKRNVSRNFDPVSHLLKFRSSTGRISRIELPYLSL